MKVRCYDQTNETHEVEIKRSELSICRVCGFDNGDYFPWGEDGHNPEFTICECCGAESGYEDSSIWAIHTHRNKWLQSGAQWREPEYKPEGWNLEEALARIPKVFK